LKQQKQQKQQLQTTIARICGFRGLIERKQAAALDHRSFSVVNSNNNNKNNVKSRRAAATRDEQSAKSANPRDCRPQLLLSSVGAVVVRSCS
jgi:hypothetical protein